MLSSATDTQRTRYLIVFSKGKVDVVKRTNHPILPRIFEDIAILHLL